MNKPIEGKVLGKQVAHPQSYAPEILVAVPRIENRRQYGIDTNPDLFTGYDAWHAYELGFLTQKGLPVTGLLKLVYCADSQFLVESKSLKLYLNSFNMSYFGDTPKEGLRIVKDTIENDLSKLLATEVQAHIFPNNADTHSLEITNYLVLESLPECERLEFSEFSENPGILETIEEKAEARLASHLLRSNCKITHQPDWGSVFIYYKGSTTLSEISLLRYLVSFRNENHFHEEVCEMIYKRLWDVLQPDQLMVSCIYTRRGGIDICPSRASHSNLLPKALTEVNKLTEKLIRQ